jgi:AcrR family transcriptional regulator
VPKVSEQYAKQRRRDILDGAASVIASKGYQNATVDDICRETGISKGALYGYFSSKEDILATLKVERVQRDAAAVRAAIQLRNPELAFRSMLEWVAGDEELDEKRRADIQSWCEAALNPRIRDAQVVESLLWVDASDLIVQEARRRGAIGPATETRAYAQLLACVIYGAMAMKSWGADLDVDAVATAAAGLLTGIANQAATAHVA